MKIYQLELHHGPGPYVTLSIHATLGSAQEVVKERMGAYRPWVYVKALKQWELDIRGHEQYVITERELEDATHQPEVRAMVLAALDVFTSISENNFKGLRRPGGSNRLISPRALVKLADALEELQPGALERLYELLRKD